MRCPRPRMVDRGLVPDFEERYVSFLDILGFGELMDRVVSDRDLRDRLHEMLVINETIADLMADKTVGISNDGMTAFSDSIVYSSPEFGNVLNHAHSFWRLLAKEGFFCRGAIARGPLIHEGRVCYGPAMVLAYQLESRCAVYPRIIIDEAIPWDAGATNTPIAELLRAVQQRDSDGWRYLKTFSFFSTEQHQPGGSEAAGVGPLVQQRLDEALRLSDPRRVAKFRWLAERFNETVDKERAPAALRLDLRYS